MVDQLRSNVMFRRILVAAVSGIIALSAFTVRAREPEKSIPLSDGSTVHVFADGKMGMENRFGNVVSMEPGRVMQTKNGKKITMIGDEIARLHQFLKWGRFSLPNY